MKTIQKVGAMLLLAMDLKHFGTAGFLDYVHHPEF
jgi:hypothetical protein